MPPLRIAFAAAEAAPYAKVGGLADVRVVFVANKRVGRDKVYGAPDDAKRYAFFCRDGNGFSKRHRG